MPDTDIMAAPSTELIRVVALPVIEEHLRSQKAQVDRRVAEALSLVCTEETVQAVKKVRAELGKELTSFEEQRKAVKKAVLGPYEQFEAVYKECVSDAYRKADADLKGKIDETETEIKKRCEDGLREYFTELCQAEGVEWLRYEQAGIRVDMASAKQKTPKKLREQIAAFVTGAAKTIDQIAEMDDAEELLVEYKRTLDIGNALATVQERHRRIEQEKATQAAREAARAAEAERQASIIAAVPEAVQPPTVAPVEAEPMYTCKFTVKATRTQLRRLKEFMNQEGITYNA